MKPIAPTSCSAELATLTAHRVRLALASWTTRGPVIFVEEASMESAKKDALLWVVWAKMRAAAALRQARAIGPTERPRALMRAMNELLDKDIGSVTVHDIVRLSVEDEDYAAAALDQLLRDIEQTGGGQ